MNGFFESQVENPFDPAPMLIWSDYLEEHGDLPSAICFRGICESEIHSLALLSAAGYISSIPWFPDCWQSVVSENAFLGDGCGDGFSESEMMPLPGFEKFNGNGDGELDSERDQEYPIHVSEDHVGFWLGGGEPDR